MLFAAIKSLSEANLVAPYRFIGAAALSVDNATNDFTFVSKQASIKLDDTPKPKNQEVPMEDDWQEPAPEPAPPAQKETKVEPVFENVSPGPIPEEYNNDDEWVEDADGNFVKAEELKKNKSKKSK